MFRGASPQNTKWVWLQSNESTVTKASRITIFFLVISFSHRKDFLDEIFYNMLLKIHLIFSIHHNFWINFLWKTKNFQKVYKFYQILHSISKNYPNFKLYKNMLIISWIVFLYHKIQLFFKFHVHYNLFTCGKGLLKFQNFVPLIFNF